MTFLHYDQRTTAAQHQSVKHSALFCAAAAAADVACHFAAAFNKQQQLIMLLALTACQVPPDIRLSFAWQFSYFLCINTCIILLLLSGTF